METPTHTTQWQQVCCHQTAPPPPPPPPSQSLLRANGLSCKGETSGPYSPSTFLLHTYTLSTMKPRI